MRIALTGGIGMGKSTVLGYVREFGVPTVSSDAIVAELWSDQEVLTTIGLALRLDGPPSKDAVRARIAEQPAARRSLNAVLHRRVLDRLVDLRHGVAEVPLLIESCSHGLFDRVWTLACAPQEQLRRVVARLGDEGQARALIASQIGPTTRETFADRIVRTDQPPLGVKVAVERALVEDGLVPASRGESLQREARWFG